MCSPAQVTLVTEHLVTPHGATVLDPTAYVIDCPLEAYTLGDKRVTDTWGRHSLLDAALKEGVPVSTPFALIITARPKKGVQPHPDHKLETIEELRSAYNPCPVHCTRDKHHFSMNVSRYWQEDTQAPMCQEYPFSYALANFFWWHTRPNDLMVFIGDSQSVPLIAKFTGLNVIALLRDDDKSAKILDKALKDMHVLNAPDNDRYSSTHTKRTHTILLQHLHTSIILLCSR